jgi:peptidoglycan glycosyltransferase
MVGQKDLGSSLLFFTLFVVMVWVGTEKASFMALGLAMFATSATIAYFLFDHVQTRVSIWLDPWRSYSGKGYQIAQSMFALGSGGMGGTGLGLGDPTRIPEAKNDFIFAAIGEELGLFGATAILITFLLIIGAGLRTAMRAKRDFAKLLAVGLTTIIGVQAFIIIGGVIRVVPLTGITLPFVSYGGSSLVANYVLLALLLRISDNTAKRLGETPDQMSVAERFEAARARRASRRSTTRSGS